VLVKTGWASPEARQFPKLGPGIRELGWVPRSSIRELLAAADVLVQPGGPGPYNDYRFPSKLPEFLASGRPVVTPRTNIGLELRDGVDALVLERGDAADIYEAVVRLGDAELRARLGEHGRAFALRELRWSKSVDEVEELYRDIAANNPSPTPVWALAGVDPPAKLIAMVPRLPNNAEARAARAHGIYGFCVTLEAPSDPLDASEPVDFPFCLRIVRVDGDADASQSMLRALSDPRYIRIGGAPLLLADEPRAAEWSRALQGEVNGHIHVALAQGVAPDATGLTGFDSAVETPAPAASAGRVDDAMHERLIAPFPDHVWFRSITFSREAESQLTYPVWLRKLVLQTAYRAPVQEPLIFVDPAQAWASPARREEWLAATHTGLRDGIHQFYASQELEVRAHEAEEILALP
jgi:hypothetical protein